MTQSTDVSTDTTTTDGVTIGLLLPFPDEGRMAAPFRELPGVTVHWTPYFESSDVRSAKGANGGVDPSGQATPEITDDMAAAWAECDGIVSMDLPANAGELFPKLRWFQGMGAGFDHIDTAALASLGVVQTNASGIASVAMSEFVMARLLQEWKGLRALDKQQDAHVWEQVYGNEVAGRTIGIVGLGAIGREVAKRARAFGMTVLATRGSAKPGDTDPDVDELHPAAALDDLLPRCEAVVIAAPATPQTEDLFDADRIAKLPPGAILCNMGRGTHVVEPALIAALESGQLRAAILDVARQEPLPAGDPLWDAPNLYLSPHSSVSLDNYEANVMALAIDNTRRFQAGESLRNVVNDWR